MPGGDIQLVLKSNYDAYLIGNPNITFFKSVFKRHTRFSMELIKIEPKSNRNELLENREIELEFELPHKGNKGGGDLIKETYFVFELPKIYSHNHHQFQWIKRIGQYIINEVSFFLGNQKIDTLTGEWLHIWNELYLDETKKDGYNNMIGNLSQLYQPTNISNTYPDAIPIPNTPFYSPSINSRKIIVPLPFWYTYMPGCEFPMTSISSFENPKIKIKIKPFKELYTVIDVNDNNKRIKPTNDQNISLFKDLVNFKKSSIVYNINQTHNVTITSSANPITMTITVSFDLNDFPTLKFTNAKITNSLAAEFPITNLIKLSDTQIRLTITNAASAAFTDGNYTISGVELNENIRTNTLDIKPTLEVNYIFLDPLERKYFQTKNQTYFIRQVSKIYLQTSSSTAKNQKEITIPLKNFKNSSTKIIWALRRNDYQDLNQWYNFTNWIDPDINPILNHNASFNIFDNQTTDLITPNTYDSLKHKEIILEAEFLNNGNTFLRKNWEYYQYINHYSHSYKIPEDGIYQYSFEEETDVEKWQPKRVMNLSLLDNFEMKLNFIPKEKNADGTLKEYYYNIFLFSYHYNVLNLINNSATLLFAN